MQLSGTVQLWLIYKEILLQMQSWLCRSQLYIQELNRAGYIKEPNFEIEQAI